MALTYKPVDRFQQFLLPPDMGEWLPKDHLVWFLIDVVRSIDTSKLHDKHRLGGVGRQAYDPDMLLALLFYAYCSGERSSRRIEALCETDVAYRVIAASHLPDHTTICRFRQASAPVMAELFTEILRLCAAAGMVKVGIVAIDGTKIAGDASKKANRTKEDLEKEMARLIAEAAEEDAAEDARFGDRRGDEAPSREEDLSTRLALIEQLIERLREEDAKAEEEKQQKAADRVRRAEEAAAKGHHPNGRRPIKVDALTDAEEELAREEADHEAKVAKWRTEKQAAKAAGRPVPKRPSGRRRSSLRLRVRKLRENPPPPPKRRPRAPARANTTDPDSRVMRTSNGFVQGYNAQAAVNSLGVVLSASVSNDNTDFAQFKPVLEDLATNLEAAGVTEEIGTILADAGYFSAENLNLNGPDRLIADAGASRIREETKTAGYAEGDPPPGATPAEAMRHRLRTKEGAETYKLRGSTVEPLFGDIKANRGYRTFMRRGLDACEAEWRLICATTNLNKLFRFTPSQS